MFEGVFIWLLFGFVAGIIGSKKGRGCLGFIVGVLFGPFGLLYVIATDGDRKTCPFCRELINKDALKCPKCQSNIEGVKIPKEKLHWYDYLMSILSIVIFLGIVVSILSGLFSTFH